VQLAQASQHVAEAVAKEQGATAAAMRKLAEEALTKEGAAKAEAARSLAQVAELRGMCDKYATAFDSVKGTIEKVG